MTELMIQELQAAQKLKAQLLEQKNRNSELGSNLEALRRELRETQAALGEAEAAATKARAHREESESVQAMLAAREAEIAELQNRLTRAEKETRTARKMAGEAERFKADWLEAKARGSEQGSVMDGLRRALKSAQEEVREAQEAFAAAEARGQELKTQLEACETQIANLRHAAKLA